MIQPIHLAGETITGLSMTAHFKKQTNLKIVPLQGVFGFRDTENVDGNRDDITLLFASSFSF